MQKQNNKSDGKKRKCCCIYNCICFLHSYGYDTHAHVVYTCNNAFYSNFEQN